MKNFFKNLFKMPLATYKCSTIWTLVFSMLFLSGGITTIATQVNTNKDVFNIVETKTGRIDGNFDIRSSVGLNNGFTQEHLRIFKYDASAPSGSRFTEVLDFRENELITSGDAGDRLYFGVNVDGDAVKIWGIYSLVTVAKSSEKLIAKYYSINADDLVEFQYVNLIGDCLNQNNKKIWEFTFKDYISFNKNISADWKGNNNVLDKIPNTGDNRHWLIFENPVGGVATPARLSGLAYRGSGISTLDCNQQKILWGLSKLKKSIRIPFIDFWDGGIPQLATIPITSTSSQSVHKLRSALGDKLHRTISLPYGIDTSMPIEMCISYSASTTINPVVLDLNIYYVDRDGGLISATQSSQRIVTKNVIANNGILNTAILLDDLDISNTLENYTIFVEIKRTDSNGGDFYPIDFFVDYYSYKMGKF